jgi:hypothetical protein
VGTDVDEVGQILIRECLDVADVQVAGVLHDHVQAPGLVHHRFHGCIGRCLRGDVELDHVQVEVLLLGQLVELRGDLGIAGVHAAPAGVDGVPGPGQGLGGEITDPGARTGDENNGHDVPFENVGGYAAPPLA